MENVEVLNLGENECRLGAVLGEGKARLPQGRNDLIVDSSVVAGRVEKNALYGLGHGRLFNARNWRARYLTFHCSSSG